MIAVSGAGGMEVAVACAPARSATDSVLLAIDKDEAVVVMAAAAGPP